MGTKLRVGIVLDPFLSYVETQDNGWLRFAGVDGERFALIQKDMNFSVDN